MKFSLRSKLTISYIFLALIFIISLLFVSNAVLQDTFQNYIIKLQEKKNLNLVKQITDEYGDNGELPDTEVLKSIGHTALSDGLILMVTDNEGNQVFCMSISDDAMCDEMIHDMQENMASIYPDFNGQYEEKQYDIMKNGTTFGQVTVGYYGPFYYNDEDIHFIEVLNRIFLVAAILLFIVAVLLGIFMAGRIVKPVRKVIWKTRQIEEGNFTDRITQVSRTKEIDQLIHSVNHLAETLERQQLSKKRMARDYAHEFRTPLAALQSNLEAMIDGIWEPDHDRLESCRAEILRLTRMVSDIDKIVKIENDSLTLNKTKFDLSEAVEQVVSSFQPEMIAKQIVLKMDLTTCNVVADRDKIIQVIMNLLSNAVKYTDAGGNISISLNHIKQKAVLSIQDSGIGIAEDDLPNIFEHLYRADKSRDRKTGGSGIGLSVVKAIMDAHGGSISVESQLEKGSKFTIKLS